jgi:peptidoglycan/LPS O-acetylase OafA/YrhL
MTTWVVGGVCLCLIILSACLMHYYFQQGYPKDNVKSLTLNALWLTFGKLVFVTAVMLVLISVCKTYENFPKMIANNATIQLIGNLSFSIYCWHYIVLTWVVQASETNDKISPYYYYGCFFWVLFVTFPISLWTSLAIEFPLGDLWRLVEAPFVKNFK